jgi:thioredoxin 1
MLAMCVQKVASEAGISAMPTFQVYKNGEKIEELVGASKDRLAALVGSLSQKAPALA